MNAFFAAILNGINSIIGSYGWSMVVFAFLIRLVLSPLDYKSRKSMRRMSALQPQMTKLQQKYKDDKEKLNKKTAELYQREHVNPMSSCLPMLLTFPILMIMWGAMREVGNTELAKQCIDLITTGVQNNESWLWIKNLWMPDSPMNAVIADQSNLQMITQDIWTRVFGTLSPEQISGLAIYGIDATNITSETILAALQQIPSYATETALWPTLPSLNLVIFQLNFYANNNGWFVLPILAAATQFLMTATQPQQPAADPNSQQASTGKMMKYFFPLFSLWICSNYTAAFALYWVASNVMSWIQTIIFNKMFDAQEASASTAPAGEGSLK